MLRLPPELLARPTFGEDIKVVRELCFTFSMLMPAVFALLTASMSVSEEIEGRTAVTLMSKPITATWMMAETTTPFAR